MLFFLCSCMAMLISFLSLRLHCAHVHSLSFSVSVWECSFLSLFQCGCVYFISFSFPAWWCSCLLFLWSSVGVFMSFLPLSVPAWVTKACLFQQTGCVGDWLPHHQDAASDSSPRVRGQPISQSVAGTGWTLDPWSLCGRLSPTQANQTRFKG